MSRRLLLLTLLLAPVSWAQDAAEEPTPDAGAPNAPVSWREGRTWSPISPRGTAGFADLVVHPTLDDVLAAVDEDGAVWRSEDGGVTWRSVLGGSRSALGEGSIDEDALLDAETRLNELLDELGLDEQGIVPDEEELEGELDDLDGALQSATDAAVEQLQSDALQSGFFDQVQQSGQDVDVAPRVVWPAPDTLLVARSDGLWVGDDGSWRQAWTRPSRDVGRAPSGAWVVAGPRGLAASDDLGTWRVTGPPATGAWDLATVDGQLVAATDDGLWATMDGDTWERLGVDRRPFRLVEDDPGRPGRFFAADDVNLYRTADGGMSFMPPFGPPLRAARELVVDEGGTVLVAAEGGAWASRDGGGSFAGVVDGLRGADGRGLAQRGPELWLAATDGLYRRVEVDLEARSSAVDDGFPPVGLLHAAASNRIGIRQRNRLGAASQVLLWMLPTLTLEGRFQRMADLGSELDAGLDLGNDGVQQVWVQLTWRPPGRNVAVSDPQQIVVQSGPDGPRFYTGAFDQYVALGRVDRRITDGRMASTNRINELYFDRARLVREQQRGVGELLDRVRLTLRIAETEAWLDALTDGAVTNWQRARAQDGGTG